MSLGVDIVPCYWFFCSLNGFLVKNQGVELKNFVIQKPCLQRVKKKTNKKEKKGFKKA
ncbi:hypothetical protein V5J73_12600 [Flavobacterium sp. KS-LB2]|uniref:hypothetical protein n=1 Tax=Flavobacterium sp. KS-LB2 TaxID=3120525 RepID=UPI0030D15DA3